MLLGSKNNYHLDVLTNVEICDKEMYMTDAGYFTVEQ